MVVSQEALIVGSAIALQILGILSVVLARLTERSGAGRIWQLAFLTLLLLVGGIALSAISSGSQWSLWWGSSLSLMVVGATIDFRRHRQPATY